MLIHSTTHCGAILATRGTTGTGQCVTTHSITTGTGVAITIRSIPTITIIITTTTIQVTILCLHVLVTALATALAIVQDMDLPQARVQAEDLVI